MLTFFRYAAAFTLVLVLAAGVVPAPAVAATSAGDLWVSTSTYPAHPGLVSTTTSAKLPGGQPVVTTKQYPGLVLLALNVALNGNREAICNGIKAKLTAQNGIANGYTAHSSDFLCSIGTAPSTIQLGFNSGVYSAAYVISNNFLKLTTTAPASPSSSLDPRFSVTFTMTLNIQIPVPSLNTPLTVRSATITVSNAKLSAQNATADLAVAAGDVINFFGGPNFEGIVQKDIDAQNINVATLVNSSLSQLNLSQLIGQGGFNMITGSLGSDSDGAVMVLNLSNRTTTTNAAP
jgi:hypothetical protein